MVADRVTPDPLTRYVPRLLIEWLRDAPETRHRIITGTCVFADLSGFTAMTERLATQGTSGAEEMGEVLNEVFEALLSAAYDFGAGLVKWGGDAVLLLFHGEGHAVRATRAAWVMQNTIARVGKVSTSRGPMRVRMSIGVHTGDFHFMLVGSRFQDLVVAGPAISTTARMEAIAGAGEVVLSDSTTAILEPHTTRRLVDDAHLLIEPPDAPLLPRHSALTAEVELGGLFDPVVRDHLRTSRGDYEHRLIACAFVAFNGTDDLLATEASDPFYAEVDRVITRIQEVAAEHGVVVLNTDVADNGGKVTLVAGIPHKVGDDCVRLLNAVTTIATTPSRLKLRAGVTHGRVFAGDFGAPFRGTYSLAGDVVNLAARLTYRAGPGEVFATPEVIRHSDGSFLAEPLEPFTVKGKSEPVEAVRVTRRAVTPSHAVVELPLIGRAAELAQLVAAEALAASGTGSVVDIVGDAGIGKSRLIAEYVASAAVPVLRVDGDLYAPTQPYLSAQHLVRSALGVAADATVGAVADALTTAVASRAPHLSPWLPLLAIAAGTTVPATPEVDALDSTARAERLRRVTSELLGAVLNEPTTLVLNDTHAMDDASVALIRQLCADVPSRPWSVVISRRPDSSAPALPNAIPLPLGALAVEDADALVVAASSIRIPAPRRAQLSERSGGNPLFLRALTETVSAGQDPDALPSEIEDVLTAHMDRLTPAERNWLRTAAVLGTRVDPAVLAEIADDPFDPWSSPALAEYIRPADDGTLVFAHHLIQRTAYDALPFRRRRTLHARASYAIERQAGDTIDEVADVLAIHCLRGERFDAAWQYARTAGRLARDRYALVEAAANFGVALEAATNIRGLPSREIAEVAEDLAVAQFALGRTDLTEKALVLARRHSKQDPQRLARLYLRTARQRHEAGRLDESLRWVAKGRALLSPDIPGDLRLRAELAEFASVAYETRGSVAKFRHWAETAAREAQLCGDRQRAATALSQLAAAKAQAGEPWEPVDLSGAFTWDSATLGLISNRLGVAAYYDTEAANAERLYTEAEMYFRQSGQEAKAAVNSANRAELLVDAGRFIDALPLLQSSIDELRSTRSAAYLPFALSLLGRTYYALGELADSRRVFEEAQQLAAELGDSEVQSEASKWLSLRGLELEPEAAGS